VPRRSPLFLISVLAPFKGYSHLNADSAVCAFFLSQNNRAAKSASRHGDFRTSSPGSPYDGRATMELAAEGDIVGEFAAVVLNQVLSVIVGRPGPAERLN
jgi:hypothetical protein